MPNNNNNNTINIKNNTHNKKNGQVFHKRGKMAKPVKEMAIKDGDFVPERIRRAIVDYWKAQKDGQRVLFVVKVASKPKTDEQLGYWWGVLCPTVSDETGYTVNEVHELLMEELMPEHKGAYFCPLRQRHVSERPSMATMTTAEVAQLFERAWVYLNDRGINVPHPQDRWQAQLAEIAKQ